MSTLYNLCRQDSFSYGWSPTTIDPEILKVVMFNKQSEVNFQPEKIEITQKRRTSYIESQVKAFPLLDAGKIVMPTQKLLLNSACEVSETFVESPIMVDVKNYYNTGNNIFKETDRDNLKNIDITDNLKEVVKELNRLADLDFNVFNLHYNSQGMDLQILMSHLWRIHSYESKLGCRTDLYSNYFYFANLRYKNNPYHNSIHACDVVQTFFFLLKTCNIELISNLSELEVFSCLFSAAIHDLEHPGNNNNFEIATKSVISLSYNDKGVLENFHLFKAFNLLDKQETNFTSSFNIKTYSRFRSLVIGNVLATDMEIHGSELGKLITRSKLDDFDPASKDKDFLLAQLIHASDISNPIKPFDIYKNWISRVLQEFFEQGDKEKALGLPISYLCDRTTVKVPDSQIGFIRFVVSPLFTALSVVYPNMKMVVNLIKSNEDELVKMKEAEALAEKN